MSSFFANLKKILAKIYYFKNIGQKLFKNFSGLWRRRDVGVATQNLEQKLFANLNQSKNKWPRFAQWKYLGRVLETKEKKKIKIISSLLFLTCLGLVVSLYFSNTIIAPKNGGTYSEGLVGLPKLINPLYAPLNAVDQDLTRLIYSGLVTIDNQQQIVPDLATSWEISSDGKTYTFYLKKNVKFHNGTNLTADDILFTYNSLKDPNYKSPLITSFQDVQIEKVDDYTVRFILKEPYTPFLENLTIGILPLNVWSEVSPANMTLTDYNLKPVGTGPFKFKSLSKDKLGNLKAYVLSKNTDYYVAPSYLDELNLKFYPDYESAVDALKNHNIDGLSYLPKDMRDKLSTRTDLQYHELILPQYSALFFNTANNASLKDIKIRQALAYALNREDLIKQALNNDGLIVNGPIPQGLIGYSPNIKKYDFDLAKANDLLDSAGFVKKDDSLFRQKGETELKIVLTAVNKGENALTAQAVGKMWQAVGVKVEVNLLDPNLIKSDIIKNRSFEVLLFGEILGVDPDPYPFWHSSAAGPTGFNLANFINKDADKLLEEARQNFDPSLRHEKYVQFQNILADNLPAIFLYTPKYIYPISNKVKGVDTLNIASPADRFANIVHWYLKTKRAFK